MDTVHSVSTQKADAILTNWSFSGKCWADGAFGRSFDGKPGSPQVMSR